MVQWMEAGHAAHFESYVRLAQVLGLRAEFSFTERRTRPPRPEDPVHAVMGEVLADAEAALLHGEPDQLRDLRWHVAVLKALQAGQDPPELEDMPADELLHIENRTRFPNLQEAFGSYNAKRTYLPRIIAERIGVTRFEQITHVMVALWSSEVLHSIRLHAASFRAVCPDPLETFECWWSRELPPGGRATSTLILFDPLAGGRRRQFVGLQEATSVKPRYRDYRHAAEALRGGNAIGS